MASNVSSEIPLKCHAVQMNRTGGPEVIEFNEIDTPVPAADQVLIKVEWAGVNFIDTYHRTGLYKVPYPYTFGQEASGIIVKLPTSPEVLENEVYKKKGFKLGDRVATLSGPGGMAQYIVYRWSHVVKVPSTPNFDKRIGAAITQGLTALTALKESYEVKKGDWILIHAIAGGLGLQFLQIAKIIGAHVIGTTSTAEKAALAKEHGADHVVLYDDNLVETVLKLTEGRGVHAVFDGVGKDTWDVNFDLIARKGTIVTIGNASGAVPPFSVLRLGAKNLKVIRPKVGVYTETPEEAEYYSQEYFRLVAEDGVKVLIRKEYPFSAEGVRQAQIDIASRGTVGKLVINVAAS
ncbi:NAD(P)-binding protein [Clavulina sp. PMI_390]|nr:NAD(P)-binding protein [Clavulina sp. PMI_390]